MKNDVSDLIVTLIRMQAKTNEKIEHFQTRIHQLEHIISKESLQLPPTQTT